MQTSSDFSEHVDATPEEIEYWERFKSGDDMGDLKAPPMVIEPDFSLWRQFKPYHPQLANARCRVGQCDHAATY